MAKSDKPIPLGKVEDPLYAGVGSRPRPGIAIYQTPGLHGGRYKGVQQDAVLSGQLSLTTAAEARAGLQQSFAQADEATAELTHAGSTGTVAVATPDGKVTVAQVGDSPLLIFIKNKLTGDVKVLDLTVDQKPDVPAEYRRIELAGGTVENGRVVDEDGNTLNMARAFGDHSFVGITAQPTLQSVDLGLLVNNPNIAIYMVAASDGLTDHVKPNELLQEIRNSNFLPNMAEGIVKRAINSADRQGYKTSDNISVVIAQVIPRGKATFVGVVDGHGKHGEDVSADVRDTLQQELQRYAARLRQPAGARQTSGLPTEKTQSALETHRDYWRQVADTGGGADRLSAAAARVAGRPATPRQ